MPVPNDRCIALQAAITVALAGLLARAHAADDDGARKGWHLYREPVEDNDREEVPDKALPPPPSPSASSPKAPELVELEALQRQVEARRGIAVPNTSAHNVMTAGV